MKQIQLTEDVKGLFPIGTQVNVSRLPGDYFDHNFTGHVKSYHMNLRITVEDQDGDCWECEPEQLSYCSDEVMHND